jgi:3',5'-cyclic AMP phosphodiesterase CpdA
MSAESSPIRHQDGGGWRMLQTFAHLSDLHLGAGPAAAHASRRLCSALLAIRVQRVIVTGDVTHRGLRSELDIFHSVFAPLLDEGRLLVVPGNHDRLGDDVAGDLMSGPRVQAEEHDGLFVVRFDSTGPHNRRWFDSHGQMDESDTDAICAALDGAPRASLRLLLFHHHLLPLPDDHLMERVIARLGLPNASELARGPELVARLQGRCDLVLHGHRHRPAEIGIGSLRVFNGGCSTGLQACRFFAAADGELVHAPRWLDARPRSFSDSVGLFEPA